MKLTAEQVTIRLCGLIAFAVLLSMLTGCAGLNVGWILHEETQVFVLFQDADERMYELAQFTDPAV